MKRTGDLWQQLVCWDNLQAAWEAARKGKRYKIDVIKFAANWEENLIDLQNQLIWNTWRPLGFRSFPVYEPKHRLIEAPYFTDRIIHHALHRVVEPIFDKTFIHDSFACRKGKGIHQAVRRVQQQLRQAQKTDRPLYVLQADIKGYFRHIQHYTLKQLIARKIKDKQVLRLWSHIIDAGGAYGVGQPIGALSSQLEANIYLDALDHYCKDDLGIQHYARYMDDWLIIGHDRSDLHRLKDHLEGWLKTELGLELSKWSIYPATHGINWAGYRTWATHIKPRKRNIQRAKRRMKAQARRGDVLALQASMASFEGYTKHCQSRATVNGIKNAVDQELVKRRE